MRRPVRVIRNKEKQTSTLYFERTPEQIDQNPEKVYDAGEYHVRGGLCWPKFWEADGGKEVRGYILMGAYDTQTHVLWIMEEREFKVVETIVGEDNMPLHEGLAEWLNGVWARYYCDHYYWNQDEIQNGKYLRDTLRTPLIKPKPYLTHINFNLEDGFQTVWTLLASERIKFDISLPLYEELKKQKKAKDITHPAVHALVCLVTGIERTPWKPRRI